ncbi:hypothetical protein N7462_007513 [Penicillium macrosclerotiorum]|uniref:uncharacterized protein n=1 Tax=Penicillium macrosclerotiorum TaxID=303699 RepID=UPI002547E571|nr:uncharacterized protein N7462_007513 [Penicillium macrosclerotiorum]KAJ5679269.1 hypothetical protein N7462_007513 [Penicillium macrosclerotiorum]
MTTDWTVHPDSGRYFRPVHNLSGESGIKWERPGSQATTTMASIPDRPSRWADLPSNAGAGSLQDAWQLMASNSPQDHVRILLQDSQHLQNLLLGCLFHKTTAIAMERVLIRDLGNQAHSTIFQTVCQLVSGRPNNSADCRIRGSTVTQPLHKLLLGLLLDETVIQEQ